MFISDFNYNLDDCAVEIGRFLYNYSHLKFECKSLNKIK